MKTIRLTGKVMMMVAGASLMIAAAGSGTAFAAGATLQDNEAVWGSPVSVQKMDNGAEKRFYRIQNTQDLGFRYFVYQDGQVIDDGLARMAPVAEKAQKGGLPASELSKSYYQKHPTSAQALDQKWGKAVAVRTLDNGVEERYYRVQNTQDVNFRYFQIKEGKVIASGLARVTGDKEQAAELKGVPVGFVKPTGVETVAEVESVWGKPLKVKKLANGMEERYYKLDNTTNPGNRMFLFKDGKAVASAMAN